MTNRKTVAHILSIAPVALLLAACATVQQEVAPEPTPDPSTKKNRHGLTWSRWCELARIDPTQFGSRNLPGRFMTFWFNGMDPTDLRTMHDRNRHNVMIGDTVECCDEKGELSGMQGVVSDILPNQYCAWDNQHKDIAVITLPGQPNTWQRYPNNIVRVDT